MCLNIIFNTKVYLFKINQNKNIKLKNNIELNY